ncbi:HEPN domain-containing protein [Primorskyibacter marinus]|uniref:HEPN domain-containing protein n=1 Tax=Primorskyibacter marinus TaxID=1977320 RepID=UPI00130062A3|nr:HEPN domain-containing protein [Primorskyibacter marinus]
MKNVLDHTALKAKQRAIREGFPETMGLRAHRAISWIGRAEACGKDDDARFIFLWSAFNAAYADEQEFQAVAPGERAAFVEYFGRLVALDQDQRIYKALWQRFSGPVRMLMENRYVFNLFWQYHNGIDGFEDWKERFKTSARSFAQSFQAGDSVCVLSFIGFFSGVEAFCQATSALAGAAQGNQEQKDRNNCDAVAERCACPCRSNERSDKPTDHRRPRFQSSRRA